MRIDDVPELTLPIIKPNRDYFCQYCDKVCFSRSVMCTVRRLIIVIIYLFNNSGVHHHSLNQTCKVPLHLKL